MKIITLLKQIPLVCLLLIMLPWQQASAHFQLNINIRVVHVEHTRDGIRLYMRLPTPYLLADKLGKAGEDGLPEAAPYSYHRIDNGELFHYVDYAQLAADPAGLGQLVADGHQLSGPDGILLAQVEAVRLYSQQQQPPLPVWTKPGWPSASRSRPCLSQKCMSGIRSRMCSCSTLPAAPCMTTVFQAVLIPDWRTSWKLQI
ncbi:hypothetical protein [Aliamphritea spongicola]|nr:hypothetical protein [Aliamphritea spongicola]